MKKIPFLILTALLLNLALNFAPAFVSGFYGPGSENMAAFANNGDLSEATFNVKDILSTGETQDYFDPAPGDYPPVIEFILTVIQFATRVIGSVAVIILIIGGFLFMFSYGNQQKIDEAKDVIRYAAIGLLVALFSYIIVISIQSLFISAET